MDATPAGSVEIPGNLTLFLLSDTVGDMDTQTYILPDGREVAVDATASKGAGCITYTLKGGKVVVATKKEQR